MLVYSRSCEEHLDHPQQVLSTLQAHQLYAKLSKCRFGVLEVDYLGHIISSEGVKIDMNKISSMLEWPEPNKCQLT